MGWNIVQVNTNRGNQWVILVIPFEAVLQCMSFNISYFVIYKNYKSVNNLIINLEK